MSFLPQAEYGVVAFIPLNGGKGEIRPLKRLPPDNLKWVVITHDDKPPLFTKGEAENHAMQAMVQTGCYCESRHRSRM